MPEDTPTPPEVDVAPTEPVAQAAPPADTPTRFDFDRLERMLTDVVSRLPASQGAPKSVDEVSDDELYRLATNGNQAAFQQWTQRQAERVVTTRLKQSDRDRMTVDQLKAIYTKYPELSQSGHALNTRLGAFYAALQQMGEPATQETHLQAALRAVAESRDVIGSRPVAPARAPATGQQPAQHRQPTSGAAGPPISPAEADLAQKMGVKDPAKAMAKFWERNGSGRSRVSPNIAAALNMENGNVS